MALQTTTVQPYALNLLFFSPTTQLLCSFHRGLLMQLSPIWERVLEPVSTLSTHFPKARGSSPFGHLSRPSVHIFPSPPSPSSFSFATQSVTHSYPSVPRVVRHKFTGPLLAATVHTSSPSTSPMPAPCCARRSEVAGGPFHCLPLPVGIWAGGN